MYFSPVGKVYESIFMDLGFVWLRGWKMADGKWRED